MTAHSKPYPSLEPLLSTFADWLKHRRELNEMQQLGHAEFDRIAGDLQVSPDDLQRIVRRGPHAADELHQLLKTLGIDQAALANAQPQLLRDMERLCALCQHKRQCDHDLATGAIVAHYRNYCLNAATLGELQKAVA